MKESATTYVGTITVGGPDSTDRRSVKITVPGLGHEHRANPEAVLAVMRERVRALRERTPGGNVALEVEFYGGATLRVDAE